VEPPTLCFAPGVAGSLCRLLHPAALQLVVMWPLELMRKGVKSRAQVFVDIVEIRSMFSM
jgi:hypothetical protein